MTIHLTATGRYVPAEIVTLRRVIDAKRVSLRAPLPRVFDAINHRGL